MKLIQSFLNLIFDIVFALTLLAILANYFTNTVNILDFIKIILVFMIFLNGWTIESVHLIRYGRNTIINFIFIIFQIAIYLLLLIQGDFSLKYLIATLILIATVFSIQHIIEYTLTDKNKLILKKITEPFCYIHTGRTLILLLGLVFIDYAYVFIFLAFSLSQLFPSFISRSLHAKDMNFKELFLRIRNLIIVLSTLMIITGTSLASKLLIAIFLLCYLFLTKNINRSLTRTSGNTFILGTYFFIFAFILFNYTLIFSLSPLFLFLAILSILIGRFAYKYYKTPFKTF